EAVKRRSVARQDVDRDVGGRCNEIERPQPACREPGFVGERGVDAGEDRVPRRDEAWIELRLDAWDASHVDGVRTDGEASGVERLERHVEVRGGGDRAARIGAFDKVRASTG